jgi:Flp pilus assembly protein TadG
MVELAFLLPLLVLLLFGIIQFGRAYNAKIELAAGVREGARAAALGDAEADVEERVMSAAPALALEADDITVTACTTTGGNATVTAEYDLSYAIPFFPGDGIFDLEATGVMRCGL